MKYKILLIVCGILFLVTFIFIGKWFGENMCLVDCELTPEVEFEFITKVEEFFN